MDRELGILSGKKVIAGKAISAFARFMTMVALILAIAFPAMAQSGELQQKLAAVKQAAAENKQRLHQYQWTETTQLTLKGDPKPSSEKLCQYGPDGQVQKTPIGPPPEQPSGGRVKQRVIAKKKAEMKDYMEDVKGVLSMYVPPEPQRMQQAFQAGKVSLNPAGGVVNLIFTDYAQPGDRMTLTFDTAYKKDYLVERQYLHGGSERRGDVAGANGQSAGRNQLRGADSAQRQRETTRCNNHQFELPEALRVTLRGG